MSDDLIASLFSNGAPPSPNMTAQVVTLGFGTVNLKGGTSSNIAALRVNPARPGDFELDSGANSGISVGQTTVHMSTIYPPDIGGRLFSRNVRHTNGTILVFKYKRTRGPARYADGALILRLRAEAQGIIARAILPQHADSNMGEQFPIFQGHADILTFEDLDELGFPASERYREVHGDPDQMRLLFSLTETAPARSVRPEIAVHVNQQGKTVVSEVPAAPRRRINVRRRAAGG